MSLVSAAVLSAAPAGFQRSLLLDVVECTPGSLVAVGERGGVAVSVDEGRTWLPAVVPNRTTLTGVAFSPDGAQGWAVGHDALILTSSDRGRSWSRQWQGENLEDSFLDVIALDARHVIAIGAYGLYLASSDGGITWSRQKIADDDLHLNRITRAPGGRLYIAGERGTLLASNDRGATWIRLESPYEGSFYGVLPIGEKTLVAYGLRGHVFRSPDAGISWTRVPLNQPASIATAVRTGDRRIYLAGQARSMFVSLDDGVSFVPVADPPSMAVAELLALSTSGLLFVGESGVQMPAPAMVVPRAP